MVINVFLPSNSFLFSSNSSPKPYFVPIVSVHKRAENPYIY